MAADAPHTNIVKTYKPGGAAAYSGTGDDLKCWWAASKKIISYHAG